ARVLHLVELVGGDERPLRKGASKRTQCRADIDDASQLGRPKGVKKWRGPAIATWGTHGERFNVPLVDRWPARLSKIRGAVAALATRVHAALSALRGALGAVARVKDVGNGNSPW